MSLTTEQVVDTISKVTTLPVGLFEERSSKTRGKITAKTFWCEVESDEYSVLINEETSKIFEIKNDYQTWPAEIIHNLLNQPVRPKQVDPSQPAVPVPQQPPAIFSNLPPNNLVSNINYLTLIQYLTDYVKLNPGCISSLFPNLQVNEASCHNLSAWNLSVVAGDADELAVHFEASGSIDNDIAASVTAEVVIDQKTNLVDRVEVINY